MFNDLFEIVNPAYFYLSAMLFVIGIYCAPIAVEKEIDFLLQYPRWIFRMMEHYFKTGLGFWVTFLLILVLNNISLFSSFLFGFLIITPPLFAFLTGFNVAVISFDIGGWKGIAQIFLNPIAWLEFPAAWLSFSMSFKLAEVQLEKADLAVTAEMFAGLSPLYLKYIFTVLICAALLEAAFIILTRRLEKEDEE